MQRRPQTTNPGTRPFSAAQGRPQTHQLSKRGANARSNQALPPVRQKKPQSALPLRAPQTQVRMAFPGAQQFDVSGKYWDIVSKQTEAQIGNLVPTKTRRPMTAHVTSKGWGQVADDQALGAELPPPPGKSYIMIRRHPQRLRGQAAGRGPQSRRRPSPAKALQLPVKAGREHDTGGVADETGGTGPATGGSQGTDRTGRPGDLRSGHGRGGAGF